jgi:Zn-finger nucleic acid-binding protein
MKICPYCQQDSVWRVSLKSKQNFFFKMCFECDAVWELSEAISESSGSNFEKLMGKIEQPIDWGNINKLELSD